MEWYEIKIWLEDVTGLDRDALHIYAALLIQLTTAWVLRRSLAHPLPWLAVLAVAFANEYLDYRKMTTDVPRGEGDFAGTYHDMWNTMILPSVLLIVANLWPQRLAASANERETGTTRCDEPAAH